MHEVTMCVDNVPRFMTLLPPKGIAKKKLLSILSLNESAKMFVLCLLLLF